MLLGVLEQPARVLVKPLLVPLNRQQLIPALSQALLGGVALAVQSIQRHNAAF